MNSNLSMNITTESGDVMERQSVILKYETQ